MPESQASVKTIFGRAVEIPSEEQRAEYLDEACAGDQVLRAEVDELLLAIERAGSFLGGSPAETPTSDQPLTERPGAQIGPYKLLQQIGEGGMGVVYMAEQKEPVRRRVAVKIIKPGMDTRQVIARFEAERQALALMDHPNIAKVLDAGATESGRPYFVMELVNGISVTKYCDQQHLNPRERLELFLPVCQAVQHAHQKGIIHRDLKPSNILVALYDGRPVPKIIDFGVAKATGRLLTEKTMFTELGQVVGTLEYMSPEQAERNQLDIDTRSDIYSLGVVLYELLTGETPFDRKRLRSAAFDEMLRIIREEEPVRPSTKLSSSESLPSVAANRRIEAQRLSLLVRGELDWIVMKSLEKDRARRYETASKMAEDVQHYLHNEPVAACPPSSAYRFRKFAQRNKTALATFATVSAAILLGLIGTSWQAVRATKAERIAVHNEHRARDERDQKERARREALASAQQARAAAEAERQAKEAEVRQRRQAIAASEQERQQRQEAERLRDVARKNELLARQNLYTAHMSLAAQALNNGHITRVQRLLSRHVPAPQEPDRRRFEWHYLLRECRRDRWTQTTDRTPFALAFSPDSRRLAFGASGTIQIVDVAEVRTVKGWVAHRINAAVHAVAFSPDGERIVSGSRRSDGAPGECVIWNAATGEALMRLPGIEHHVPWVGYSPDGKLVAAADGGTYGGDDVPATLRVWDARSGEPLQELRGDSRIMSVAFSPDGSRLVASEKSRLRIWDVDTGEELPTGEMRGSSVAWSPDGRLIATVSSDGDTSGNLEPKAAATLWDAQTGKKIRDLHLADAAPYQAAFWLAFSPDGAELAAGMARDNSIRVWSVGTGEAIATLYGHTNWVWRVTFSPDGQWLASTSQDGTVKVWDTRFDADQLLPGGEAPWRSGHVRGREHLAVARDGVLMAATRDLQEVVLMEFDTQRVRATVDAGHAINSLEISPDGKLLATGSDQLLQVWNSRTGELLDQQGASVKSLAFSPDGSRLFVASGDRVHVYHAKDLTRYDPLPWTSNHGPIEMLVVSADGRYLAAKAGSYQGAIYVWDLPRGALSATFRGPRWLTNVAFSPDGQRLAASSGDWFSARSEGTTHLWDLTTGEELAALKGHDGLHTALAFAPDGGCLATASDTGEVILWDLSTYEERFRLVWKSQAIDCLAYSHDGMTLIGGSTRETVKFWQTAPADQVIAFELNELEQRASQYTDSRNWDAVVAIYAHLRKRGRDFYSYRLRESLANCYLGNSLRDAGDAEGAERAFHQATLFWHDARMACEIARTLATEADPELRIADQAVRFAERAVELDDQDPFSLTTLGIALYRDGQWAKAVEALEKADSMTEGGIQVERMFFAMAHWQLGDRNQARKLYAEAAAWMARNPALLEPPRFRAEAAELMGLSEGDRQQAPTVP